MDAVCATHPEQQATAYCAGCGKAYCQTCLTEEQGVFYCQDPICREIFLKAVHNRLKLSSLQGDVFAREKAIRFVRINGVLFLIFSIINLLVTLNYSGEFEVILSDLSLLSKSEETIVFLGKLKQWFFFLDTFMSIDKYFAVSGIIAGMGLMLLKNWGRYLFIMLLVVGAIYMSVSFYVGYNILQSIIVLSEQSMQMVMPVSYLSAVSSVSIVVFAITILYFLYLIKRLVSQEIREVFN